MCRSPALTALLLLTIAPAMSAHETDQFTIPGDREIADVGPYLNHWVYGFMERAVEKTNGRIRHAVESGDSGALADLQSPSHLVRTINGEIPWAMDVIEGHDRLFTSPQIMRRYPGRVVGYKEPFRNILQHTHFFLDPRQLFRVWLACTVKAYGTYMGNDKIGHFTDMGMNYWREYEKARADGKSEAEAEKQVIHYGTHGLIFSERGMLGYMTAGAYSNGDLSANYLGFLFYRNLTAPVRLKGSLRPPLLVREGAYWKFNTHVRRDSDFFALFISDHLDEALNPSLFEADMRGAVRRAVRDRAPLVLQRYADHYGNIRPAEWFNAKVKELSTYYGADYGHDGNLDQFVAIGNTCFEPQAVAAVPQAIVARPKAMVASIGTIPPPRPDPRGRTSLHWAAGDGEASIAALLGSTEVNARDNDGRTALHLAALADNARAAGELLRAGAKVDARDRFNITPLHLAATHADSAIAKLLLDAGAMASARDDFGRTPLHDAASGGADEVVKLLLSRGADIKARDDYGTTALHLASRQSHILTAGLLLDRGADIKATTAAGATPLHEAALAGDRGLSRMLVARGAPASAKNSRGQTPAEIASARGYSSVVEVLHASK